MIHLPRLARLAGMPVLVASLAACQSVREQEIQVRPEVAHAFLADKPAELKRHFLVALAQGKRNRVLNNMRLGLASMELGRFALAEQLFDDALDDIETIHADNPDAARARGLFSREQVKDFKGEPYERAMAYYYRGLLYLRAGDYDNARASFRGGFLQDSFAEEDQNRADFALLQYLQGWASRCRGNAATAQDDFREFSASAPGFPLPATDETVLVLAETGSAPIKYSHADTSGATPKFLKVRRASASETARLTLAGPVPAGKGERKGQAADAPRQVALGLLEDIFFQASTRGGRQFDSILAGKAQFKSATDTIGDAALVGAAAAALYAGNTNDRRRQRDAAAAAGTLLLIGLLGKGLAQATEAEADARYWDNLPDRVHAVTVAVPDGIDRLSVDFLAVDGTLLRTREVAITRAGPCGIAWLRGEPAVPANPRAPHSVPRDVMYTPVIIPPKPSESGSALPGDRPAGGYAPSPRDGSRPGGPATPDTQPTS